MTYQSHHSILHSYFSGIFLKMRGWLFSENRLCLYATNFQPISPQPHSCGGCPQTPQLNPECRKSSQWSQPSRLCMAVFPHILRVVLTYNSSHSWAPLLQLLQVLPSTWTPLPRWKLPSHHNCSSPALRIHCPHWILHQKFQSLVASFRLVRRAEPGEKSLVTWTGHCTFLFSICMWYAPQKPLLHH